MYTIPIVKKQTVFFFAVTTSELRVQEKGHGLRGTTRGVLLSNVIVTAFGFSFFYKQPFLDKVAQECMSLLSGNF